MDWYIQNHQPKKERILIREYKLSRSKWGPFLFFCLILPFTFSSCCCCLLILLPTLSHYATIMTAQPYYNSKTHFRSTLHRNPIYIFGLVVPLFLSKQNIGKIVQIVASGMVSRATPCQVT